MINLEEIKDPSFIKSLSIKELKELCAEIRKFLIENLSKTGGHLSSNLGVVEITVAMYYVFDPEKDKFLFDVGHQSYVHKILTGRAKDFKTLRQFDGMSGYINRKESKYDVWESGHSSTTISAMSGMLLSNENGGRVIALIGDSSISNGVAFEGINFLGQYKNAHPIIILNDNKMGISKSVGALTRALNRIRGNGFYRGFKMVLNKIFPGFITRGMHQIKRGLKGMIQRDNIFEDLGFDYFGPYEGNDLKYCIRMMEKVRDSKEAAVLHLITKKGMGYAPSEADTTGSFHGVGPFDIATGKPLSTVPQGYTSYSKLVCDYLVHKREKEQFFCVTPAMKAGAKLEDFASKYPHDFFDVGIAEEHAAVMSAGIATNGKNVVLLMYSTFAQRAYDEILNDIARSNLKVVIGIDRAGIVGEDGATHQGLYDISMFEAMPNIKIVMPRDAHELVGLFNYALSSENNNPIVIRYPRGNVYVETLDDYDYKASLNWDFLTYGNDMYVLSYGPDVERIKNLVIANDLNVGVIDAKSLKPVDYQALKEIFKSGKPVLVVEQTVSSGTLYDKVLEYKEEMGLSSKVYKHSFDCDTIIPHGKVNDVYNHYGFSDEHLLEKIKEVLKK